MSRHWRIEQDGNGIIWLHFNQADSSANVLTVEALDELDQQLGEIEQASPAGVVFCSDKPSGFIAGADVKAFSRITEMQEAQQQILQAHAIFDRIERLKCPTVAMIHGFCLGGGTELALACRYRVSRDDPGTRIGLPEVRLGIFPGFGGTVRSTRLIGHLPALNIMLSGRALSGSAARRLGLVDMSVPERQLKAAARHLLSTRPKPHRPTWLQQLPGNGLLRPLVGHFLKKQVAKQADPAHYPAPYALIRHWTKHANHPKAMYRSEAAEVAKLISSDTAQNLIRIFLLQDQLKAQGRKSDFKAAHVHVIGGGIMGGDIAAWCALKGMRVTLQDRAPELLSQAMGRAHGLFKKKLKKPLLVRDALDRLIPDCEATGVPKADVVIEAIFENTEAKQQLYAQLEPRLKKGALLCTNTSSIPLEVLNSTLKNPARLVGLHFFNPVAKMQLVEIVSATNTDPNAAQQAAAFAKQIGRLPLPVKSSPGFLVNRILMPYLLEAIVLLDSGTSATAIDKAATDFGMPMGPVELADTVGLDICLAVADKLAESLPVNVPEMLRSMVSEGKLGRKSGQGFYLYNKGKAQKAAVTESANVLPGLADRMIMCMLNEAVACLREGIVSDADLLDAGIVFGTGFAPFRGGPIHYVKSEGKEKMQPRIQTLASDKDAGWADIFEH
ncbi:MAG: 3-hydroxyacyl-CoA dehydrogenase NAD-binding domain-containing protein [Candidatus Polarisedimenticolaceae bacterium]|nr:3-hydroxyacyl-CoA dehydrogenase NAD-binding domain-containing protein [Candidatus Polarisedimenticolaceae bacterium]